VRMTGSFLCLLALGVAPASGRGGDREEEAVAAIKKAGGTVTKVLKGPNAGKYNRVICPKEPERLDAVMKEVKHLKHLDTLWFWADRVFVPKEPFADKYMAEVAAIGGLKNLHLKLATDAGMKLLGSMKKLEVLVLNKAGVSEAAMQELTNLAELKDVVISGFTDDDLKHIGRLPKLQELFMSGKTITDRGMKHLTGLNKLRALFLSNTAVADVGLKDLAGLPELRSLRLADSPVNDQACKILADFQQLTVLDLFGTKITDAGAKHLAGMNSLEKLDLTNTELTDAGLIQLVKGCKALKQLAIRMTKTTQKGRQEFHNLRPKVNLLD
jgi:internalin A